jgi:hypothetical protein
VGGRVLIASAATLVSGCLETAVWSLPLEASDSTAHVFDEAIDVGR